MIAVTGNPGILAKQVTGVNAGTSFYIDIQNAQAHIHDDDSDGSDGSGQSEQPVGIPVTVVQGEFGNNVFAIDGVQQDALNLMEGKTYVFDWSGASGHPFTFFYNF